jgi:hypothetical protein
MNKIESGFNSTTGIDPVRKIGMNHTSLTGMVPSLKSNRLHQFESSLERDFIRITEFDSNVAEFVEQPVVIEYVNEHKPSRYVPDFLISYKHTTAPGKWLKPLLVEIKYRDDLKKNWAVLKPKFLAAMKFCDQKGWKFKILTEVEIRTEFLQNARFFQQYKNVIVNIEDYSFLLSKIHDLRVTTPTEIVLCSSDNLNRRASLLYCLWYMIANTVIGVDLSKKITMNSTIWDNTSVPQNVKPL